MVEGPDANVDARRIGIALVQALGALWTLPNTLAGLLAGLAALTRGAKARIEEGALVFHGVRFGPGGALTLGQVILHTGQSLDTTARTYWCRQHGGDECVRLADHERAHVYQYLVLGPLFLPVYFLCGGISWRNRFEQAADRYAASGRGWWPWPRPLPRAHAQPPPEAAQPGSESSSSN
jgi:hypothetical protein